MSNIFLYGHGGSGNHGCEAIVRSTVKIFCKDSITLISSRPEEDLYYGINHICTLLKDTVDVIDRKTLSFLRAYVALKCRHDYVPMERLRYKKSFANVEPGDIAFSIGGDNYCYADAHKYVMMHEMMKNRGAKTVLWGCSVEPEVANKPEIAADLARYNLIVSRESITQGVLQKINPNTFLLPDPAFFLDIREKPLPNSLLKEDTVGINISPLVLENESISGIIEQNYEVLIDFLLYKTNMNIALIPHVVWEEGDDRTPLQRLYRTFEETGRIFLIEDHRCDELKYIISKCKYFVGARTHATIAAYSTGVPTLVIGYSVKARGIARDLFGTEEGYVLEAKKIKRKDEILNSFLNIIKNGDQIRKQLENKMKFANTIYAAIPNCLRQLQMEKKEDFSCITN